MKSIVIYFSQTGNTEKVAKQIQKGIKQVTGNCDLAKIKDINPDRLSGYDLIGLGCPIFEYVEPLNVRRFIKDLRFVGGKNAFIFSTHGAFPEYFFPNVIPKLIKRGLVVIGMHDWYSKVYLSQMPDPYPTEGHLDQIDLMEAEAFGREMAEHSERIYAGEKDLIPAVPKPTVPPPPIPKEGQEHIFAVLGRGYASILKFHRGKCSYPDCRLCMDNCPMDGIDLTTDPPIIAKPCMNCTFCAKICPNGALDDDEWINLLVEMGSSLYFKEEILAVLDKAEKDGRFRRLLPEKNIGYNTRICQTYNKHPQWIIGKGLNRE